MQNKNDAFFGVGDTVRGKLSNGDEFEGEITCIDIRLQKGKLYTCMDYKYKQRVSLIEMGLVENESYNEFVEQDFEGSVWVENITKLEILSFN